MRSFSLSESSSDVVRSIGASALPLLLILRGESTSILTAFGTSSLSLLSSPSSRRTLTRVACTRASRAGRVDVWELGPLYCGAGPDSTGMTSMLFPHSIVLGAKSFRTCQLSSLSSLATLRVSWVNSLRTFRLSSIYSPCNDPSRHPHFFLDKSPCHLP